MIAADYARFMGNQDLFMDKAADGSAPVPVSRENNRNIVILSEETYSNLMENLHVFGCGASYDWLMESKRQPEEGGASAHELIEVNEQ